MNYDIIIGVCPVARTCPQTGPSLIKSFIESNGYTCKVCDWNIELYDKIKNTEWEMLNNDPKNKELVDNIFEKYYDLFQEWVQKVKVLNPRWLGISVFSERYSLHFIYILCKLFKKEISNIKIVIGGHYTKHLPDTLIELLNKGLIDKIVRGEGEIATLKLLDGCEDKIISCPPIKDIESMPFADYYDLDFDKYSSDLMLIVGSRGCINHCDFCQRFTSGYRSRDGESIADELLSLYINFGAKTFYLSDACSNGNIKQFRRFVEKIKEYNDLKILPPIKWRTQLACRPKEIMTEDLWELMHITGFDILAFGLETGSERLRFEMGKHVKNEDIEFLFLQCLKNNIRVSVSMICGYYTETEEDFKKTLKFLKKWAVQIPAIKEIYFGGFLNLEKGSPLYDKKDELGIEIDEFDNWKYKENDYPFRYKRWLKMKKFLEKNNIKYTQRLEVLIKDEIKNYGAL
jgi:radical SAM superfamily enzyme YgiQ (UPF0313 family)